MATKGEINRQRIISTADDLFYRQGYDHTSFTDIADAAEIARGNFYYYYKSKDEILSEVIKKRGDDIKHMLNEWDQDLPEPRDRLKRYVSILTKSEDEIQHYGCPMGSLCTELAKLRHGLQDTANDLLDIFHDWLVTQFSLLGHKADANELALHLMARLQGISLITNAYQDTTFLKREADGLMQWVEQL